jgi:hypothetical protein
VAGERLVHPDPVPAPSPRTRGAPGCPHRPRRHRSPVRSTTVRARVPRRPRWWLRVIGALCALALVAAAALWYGQRPDAVFPEGKAFSEPIADAPRLDPAVGGHRRPARRPGARADHEPQRVRQPDLHGGRLHPSPRPRHHAPRDRGGQVGQQRPGPPVGPHPGGGPGVLRERRQDRRDRPQHGPGLRPLAGRADRRAVAGGVGRHLPAAGGRQQPPVRLRRRSPPRPVARARLARDRVRRLEPRRRHPGLRARRGRDPPRAGVLDRQALRSGELRGRSAGRPPPPTGSSSTLPASPRARGSASTRRSTSTRCRA